MPSCEEHLQQYNTAKSVQCLLQAEDANEYADWIVITAFYQALHLVDAFFAFDSDYHPEAHGPTYDDEDNLTDFGRNTAVRKHRDLWPIRDSYFQLYDASITARYQVETYKNDHDEVEWLLKEGLDPIVRRIKQLIGESQFQS